MSLSIEEQLTAVRSLDTLDRARWAAEERLESLPKQLAEERAAVAGAVAEQTRLEGELAAAQARVREGERELAVIERRRKRAADRMPYLTSSTQIEATQREVAKLEEERDAVELATLEVMEEVETLEGGLAAARDLAETVARAIAKREADWAAEKGSLEAVVAEKAAAREAVVAPLSAELMRMYRGGVKASSLGKRTKAGATTVDGATCNTCWAEVPRRWVNETIARRAIYTCQNCKRIVLADPADPEPATAPA